MSRPWIHQTDLFRRHSDPDDHWDLVTVYALVGRRAADLLGVLIDYPPADQRSDRDPDVAESHTITMSGSEADANLE
jgi:hypothetical protein